jgi:potassium/sodium efflux P-type ATPase
LAIGILVAALPEGLIPTVTLTLAMSVQRLAQKGVLVKKLSSVETLGTVSVICTDKSGTLTQNQMTVRELWVGNQKMKVTGSGYDPKGQIYPADEKPNQKHLPVATLDLRELLQAGLLCNNSRLNPPGPEHPQWTSLGDPTEAALKVLAIKGEVTEPDIQQAHPRIHELPFDARRKRMTTIHQGDGVQVAYVKGAPKEVLQLCSNIFRDGEVTPLDDTTRKAIISANDAYARQAYRVLALARRELPENYRNYSAERVENQLTFLGLVAMMDPPRPDVANAVQSLQAAGIRMVMITGDYGLTAESMARRLGMIQGSSPRILTGAELDQLNAAELASLIREEVIFARMAPEHKLRLVDAFQSSGEVIAVIGDGVNDAPALRKADVGISMGRSGTDVSREASDIVLIQDNFSGITAAVQEGRAVYDNLRKFITYIFSSNVPEIAPFVLTALFNIPIALTVIQILAIDLGTDLLPALALGIEHPEPDVMHRQPRRRNQPIIDRSLLYRAFFWLGPIEAVLCFVGFYLVYAFAQAGSRLVFPLFGQVVIPQDPTQLYILATTVFHAGVVSAQIGNAFACRTERGPVHRMGWLSNRLLLAAIAGEALLLLAMIYISPLARVFQHNPFPPIFWVIVLAYGPVLYILERGRKNILSVIQNVRKPKHEGVFL